MTPETKEKIARFVRQTGEISQQIFHDYLYPSAVFSTSKTREYSACLNRNVIQPGIKRLNKELDRPIPRMSRRVGLVLFVSTLTLGAALDHFVLNGTTPTTTKPEATSPFNPEPNTKPITIGALATATPTTTATPKPRVEIDPPSNRLQKATVERLQAVLMETLDLSPAIRRAFIEGGTSAYSGISTPDRFQRIRTLEYSQTSTQQIIDLAKAGNLFMGTYHPAVIGEFEFLTQWAKQPESTRNRLLEAYADGLVAGLMKIYNPNETVAIALEVGHMSNAPKDKIASIKADRQRRGISTPLNPTQDTGAYAEIEGKPFWEREVNYPLARLIAVKIIQSTKWVPVFNSRSEGFPAERFTPLRDNNNFYIYHRDGILTMKFKWEELLAASLAKANIKMGRIALHFNGGGINQRDGYFIPQNAKYQEESQALARALSTSIQEKVRTIQPNYKSGVNLDLNSNPFEPYWMLDSYVDPNPQDVLGGNVSKVRGAINRTLAQIRCESLGRRDCN